MFLSVLLQERHITHSIMPQAEIGADDHSPNVEVRPQLVQECVGSQRGYCRCEMNHDAIRHPAIACHQRQFLFERGQALQLYVWSHHQQCVWRKCYHNWFAAQRLSYRTQFMQQTLVPAMDTIKIANSDGDWLVFRKSCYKVHSLCESRS